MDNSRRRNKLRHRPFWGLGKSKKTGKCYQHILWIRLWGRKCNHT